MTDRGQSNGCCSPGLGNAPQLPLVGILDPDSPAGRFHAFHTGNPHVYEVLVAKAREWAAAGNGKLGMSLLFGMVRWVLALETQGDPYRINDHYIPFYARLIMQQEPDLRGIFNLREAPEADLYVALVKNGLVA